MKRPIALTRLIDTLVQLFPTENESRMIVKHAGIDDRNIAYDARALVNWTNIVHAALRPDRLDELVDAAGELHPELRDDMRSLVRNYRKWAERNAPTEEAIEKIAAQPPPRIRDLIRTRIAAWSGVALGAFAFVGILARESRHLFLGLPGSHWNDLLESPRACAIEGAMFLGRTGQVAWRYAMFNPIGTSVLVILASAFWLLRSRLRRIVRRAWTPVVVIPLIVICGAAKLFWYDAPAFHFTSVLSPPRNWIRLEIFDVRPPLTDRARAMWRAEICTRIAEQDDDDVRATCGTQTSDQHAQDLLGTYMFNVLFTIAICITGIAAIRKLILPSQRRDWNLRRGDKRLGVALTAAGVLLALLPLPWTYSRTVRPTDYPRVSDGAQRAFRICAEDGECFAYRPGRKLEATTRDLPPRARVEERDVLTAMLVEQIGRRRPTPPDRGVRFP